MERTKRASEDGKIRWRKTGGGSFRLADGRIIKPNQIFVAAPSEISESFLNLVIPLDEMPKEKAPSEILGSVNFELKEQSPEQLQSPVDKAVYAIEPRGVGWWNVVQAITGKVMNHHALRKGDAEKLLESLQA